ncbi:MAG: hypothetical protein EA378_01690 [Phycisphaerales bacterium]|nr:MAG: hypothetical protein EA378_01690 [Phycisphaerales bacterium]
MPADDARPTTENPFGFHTNIVGPNFQHSPASPKPALKPAPARTPSRVAEDAFVDLRIGPSDEADEPADVGRLARRLLIAFIVIAGVWIVFVTLLAQHVSPMVPVLASGAIMLGAVLAAIPERRDEPHAHDDLDDAKPIGCCSGPRPLGEMSRKAARRGNTPPPGACCR